MTIAPQGGGVKPFYYGGNVLGDLEASFSPDRMSTYLNAVQGNREKAFQLYAWNTAVSGAFYGPLQGLEVALRNGMHRELSARYGGAWYDNPSAGFDKRSLEQIADARKRAGGTAGPSRIVAALSFGFWVSLLGSGGRIAGRLKADYERTLWRPALRKTFAHCSTPLTRKQAHQPLLNLRVLRNRIAHQEPIFARRLIEDHQCILEVTGWISPEVRTWIDHHSRVCMLLGVAPSKVVHF